MRYLFLLLAFPIAACAATPPAPVVIDTSCSTFRAISYAQLPAGQVDDPGNKADSDETVAEIDQHNAKYDASCPIR